MRHSLGVFLRFNDYLFVDLLESNFGKRAMYLCVNYVIIYIVERNSGGHLAIVGKAFLQFLAGEEDTALNGAEGQIHVFGYLVVFVAGNVHREGYAVFFGESVDGVGDLAGVERTFGSFETAVLADVEVVEVFGGINNCGGALGATVVVDEDVAHDCEHPSFEVGTFGILLLIVESLEGCVLQQVVSVVAVRGKHVSKVQQVALELHKV